MIQNVFQGATLCGGQTYGNGDVNNFMEKVQQVLSEEPPDEWENKFNDMLKNVSFEQ